MYHRLRTMAGTTEDPRFAAAVDVCVDVAENMTLDEMSWNIDPGAWMESQDVAGFNSTLTTMNTKLDMIDTLNVRVLYWTLDMLNIRHSTSKIEALEIQNIIRVQIYS